MTLIDTVVRWMVGLTIARDFVYIVRSAALGDHHPVTSIEIIQLRLSSPVSNVYQNGTSRIQYRIPERNSEINGIQHRQYCQYRQYRQRYSPERWTVIQNSHQISQRISQRIQSSIYALAVLYRYSPPRFPILSRVVLPHHNIDRGIKYIALDLEYVKLFIFVDRLFINNKDFSS